MNAQKNIPTSKITEQNLVAVRLSRCVRGVAALAAAAGLTAAIFEGAACGTDNF
jgi:hypothetical protein